MRGLAERVIPSKVMTTSPLLHEQLHVGCRNKTRFMAMGLSDPASMMRCGTSRHRHHAGQLLCQQLIMPQPRYRLVEHDRAVSSDTANLETALGKINSQYANL